MNTEIPPKWYQVCPKCGVAGVKIEDSYKCPNCESLWVGGTSEDFLSTYSPDDFIEFTHY